VTKFLSTVGLTQRATNPTGVAAGEIYYNTDTNEVRLFNGVDWVSIGTGGGGGGGAITATEAVVVGKLTENATVATNADLVVPFVDYADPNSWWNATTKRFTPNIAGYYNVTLQVWWNAGAITNNQNNIQMRKNGNTIGISQTQIVTGSGYSQNVTRVIYLNGTTDYIDFTAYSSNSSSQVLQYGGSADSAGTFFSAALMTSGAGVPSGGLEGQILSKTSDTNYAVSWIDNYASEIRFVCKNDSGSTIAKGVPVYAAGALGDTIKIAPAIANGTIDAQYFLGVTAESITNGSTGYVTVLGEIKGIDTSTRTLGDLLYISPTTAGTFTTTHPSAPYPSDAIAIVTKIGNSSAGRIIVRMWRQSNKVSDLFDVDLTGVADGDTLVYDTTTSTWLPGASTGGVYNWDTGLDGGDETNRIQYAEITGGRISELVDGGGVS